MQREGSRLTVEEEHIVNHGQPDDLRGGPDEALQRAEGREASPRRSEGRAEDHTGGQKLRPEEDRKPRDASAAAILGSPSSLPTYRP